MSPVSAGFCPSWSQENGGCCGRSPDLYPLWSRVPAPISHSANNYWLCHFHFCCCSSSFTKLRLAKKILELPCSILTFLQEFLCRPDTNSNSRFDTCELIAQFGIFATTDTPTGKPHQFNHLLFTRKPFYRTRKDVCTNENIKNNANITVRTARMPSHD